MKQVPADAPGCSAAGPGVADDAAGRVLPVVHRAVSPRSTPARKTRTAAAPVPPPSGDQAAGTAQSRPLRPSHQPALSGHAMPPFLAANHPSSKRITEYMPLVSQNTEISRMRMSRKYDNCLYSYSLSSHLRPVSTRTVVDQAARARSGQRARGPRPGRQSRPAVTRIARPSRPDIVNSPAKSYSRTYIRKPEIHFGNMPGSGITGSWLRIHSVTPRRRSGQL
jgi:hypothetical protein